MNFLLTAIINSASKAILFCFQKKKLFSLFKQNHFSNSAVGVMKHINIKMNSEKCVLSILEAYRFILSC